MSNTGLSQEEMQSLMEKNEALNLDKIQAPDFVNHAMDLSKKFFSSLNKEFLNTYKFDTNLKMESCKISKPEFSASLNYNGYIHIEYVDRLNSNRKLFCLFPKQAMQDLHNLRNPANEFEPQRFVGVLNKMINTAFSVYEKVDNVYFEIANIREINQFDKTLSEDIFQEAIVEITVGSAKYNFITLLTFPFLQDLLYSYEYSDQVSRPYFEQMSNNVVADESERGIEFLYNVPLDISVILGKTKRTVKDVLRFTTGQVIELDRMVDSPLELYVNNQMVAKGEVVVVDDNFAIRIVELVNIEKDKLL